MQIAIARHGETDLNKQRRFQSALDEPLNDTGRKQANDLALWVSKFRPTCVLSSPLLRAKQTAELATVSLGMEFRIDNRLKEREAAAYEGLPIDELARIRKDAGHCFRDPTQDWDSVTSVESDSQVSQRFFTAIESIEEGQNERILVVTHAGVAKSVFHEVFLIPPQRTCVLKIRNGGVILLDTRPVNEWAFLGLWNPI